MSVDVAVIGSGPAGASAARRVALSGRSVALFEREPMPRFKVCGGAVSERALSYLGFPLPDEMINAHAFGARLHLKTGAAEARTRERMAVLVSRDRFDHYLHEKALEAGARVMPGDVKSVEVEPDGATVRADGVSVRARCAIVCEGAAGRLALLVRPPDPPVDKGFCIAADVPVTDPDLYPGLRDIVGVFFGVADCGYGWMFHHGDHYSVGIGGRCSDLKKPLQVFRDFVRERGLSCDGLRPRGSFIPAGGVRRRLVADRLLLAGDAAGFVDPLCGEGIAYAIRSGQLAAETALEAIEAGRTDARTLSRYERRCRGEFASDLRLSLMLTKLLHRWPDLLLNVLAADEGVVRSYIPLLAGRTGYRDFIGWVLPRLPALWLKSAARP